MKAKILSLVVLMSLSAALMAQSTDVSPKKDFHGQKKEGYTLGEKRGFGGGLNLTDVQKEAFKQSRLAMQKQILPIHNELGEAVAHQKTLVSAESPDFAAINSNIEKIGALRVELAKIQVKHRLDMRAQLTDEQKQKFDLFKERMKHGKGTHAMKHQWGNKSEHPNI